MTSADHKRAIDGWDKFLNPDNLKANLIRASTFLAAFELLRSSTYDHLRGLFSLGFDREKDLIAPDYKLKVLDLHPRDPLHASFLWFLKQNAITDDDLATISAIRKHRNDIAHELPKYLTDIAHNVDGRLMSAIQMLIAKIDRWWFRNVEAPTNPDFDDQDIEKLPDSEIHSGNMIAMDLILHITEGREGELAELHQSIVSAWNRRAFAKDKVGE